MRSAGLAFLVIVGVGNLLHAQSSSGLSKSVPRGSRSVYGTDFGNRYQYLGLGYGYGPGSFGPGAWSAFGGRRGYGGYGGYRGYGGYGGYRSGRYADLGIFGQQAENVHEQEMMWSMNFAPMPQTAPGVTVNPYWNPYQSRLHDDIFQRAERPPRPAEYANPFVRDHH